MRACECLNVVIESENGKYEKVDLESLNLTEEERHNKFFKQDIEQVVKLQRINKALTEFIQTNAVGSWIVHRCINCNTYSHAVHQQRGAAFVLIASKLLTRESIEDLQKSRSYSNVFKIIIKQTELEDDDVEDLVPSDLQITIRGLKQILSETLTRETAAVEERIRLFTQEQTNALEAFRKRAVKEHKTLVRVITNDYSSKNLSSQLSIKEVPLSMSSSRDTRSRSSFGKPRRSISGGVQQNVKKSPVKSSSDYLIHSAVDMEDPFFFDPTDDDDDHNAHADIEDNDEVTNIEPEKQGGIGIPKNKNQASASSAKSLPMNIPVFSSALRNHVQEDSDDGLSTLEDGKDIAASIKALAKSVHGDAVFGDLPRPRFRTQI